MRRRVIVMALVVLASLLLQTTVIQQIPVTFISPNLLLILVVSYGFMQGKRGGMILGLISGLLLDLFYGRIFGFHGLVFMIIGYVNGFFYKLFFDEDLKVPIMLAGISDFVYGIVFYLFQFALRTNYSFSSYLRYTILPETVSTILLTIIVYKLFFLINKKLSAYELEEQRSPWLGK